MNDVFKQNDNSWYNLRQSSEFSRPLVKPVYHVNESVAFLGPITWDILLDDHEDLDDFSTSKNKIKKWKPKN